MRIVKNIDFRRDDSRKRHHKLDSPLRFPMHAELAQTHEERIQWLYYENIVILTEYLSAKLLYDIAKVRFLKKALIKSHLSLVNQRIEVNRNLKWWVWEDLNFRPHPYQGCALTKLSYRPTYVDRASY